jgi:hypothetical protein
MLIFQGERETRVPGGKTLVAREKTNKQLNSHEVPELRVEQSHNLLGERQHHPCNPIYI